MKKLCLVLVLFFLYNTICSQPIFIGNDTKNRKLMWSDFTGEPDANSAFDANTFWRIDYNINGIIFDGDTAKIKGYTVVLKLVNNLSWVKPQSQTDYLLNHEQMHFNIAIICQNEILQKLKNTTLFKKNFKTTIPKIFAETLEKYKQMENTYDEETNHSKNNDKQTYWNNLITTTLQLQK